MLRVKAFFNSRLSAKSLRLGSWAVLRCAFRQWVTVSVLTPLAMRVLPMCRVFPCATPAEVRSQLPGDTDVVAFQCRNPVHRAHYELFTRALHAPNVRPGAVCLVHPTCGPTQVCMLPAFSE